MLTGDCNCPDRMIGFEPGVWKETRALALVASTAATVREKLLELVVRSGLGVVGAMLEADRETPCGRVARNGVARWLPGGRYSDCRSCNSCQRA